QGQGQGGHGRTGGAVPAQREERREDQDRQGGCGLRRGQAEVRRHAGQRQGRLQEGREGRAHRRQEPGQGRPDGGAERREFRRGRQRARGCRQGHVRRAVRRRQGALRVPEGGRQGQVRRRRQEEVQQVLREGRPGRPRQDGGLAARRGPRRRL